MKNLIIGASAAGISAAKKLRKLDNEAEITIISKDEEVYSRCMLHHLIGGERTLDELSFISDDFWQQYDINWLKGKEVKRVQPEAKSVLLANNSEYEYDQLLVATGSTPFLPPIDNIEQSKGVFGLRDLADAKEIASLGAKIEEAVVIGAGLVGMDAALGLNELGLDLTIVEFENRILARQLDEEASLRYQARFNEAGIKVITNRSAEEVLVDAEDQVQGLKLDNGEEVSAQLVVVATGVRPNLDLINNTPIKVDEGIVVNQYQETNLDDIYAAGDVSESEEIFSDELTLTPIWPLAVKQGKVAAHNMAGEEMKLTDNFAYQNSMRFLGLSAITYGLVEVDSADYNVYVSQDKNNYKKLILKDNKLRGAIFVGDINESGVYGKLIKEKIDLSNYKDRLFELSYGDFFREKKNGEFRY